MKRKNRNKGFTLVELLVTVVILALVVAPFLAAFVYASGNNLNASKKQDAANLAEDIAEEIKGKSLTVLDNDPKWSKDVDTGEYEIEIKNNDLPDGIGKNFRATVTLKPSDNAVNNAMPTLTNVRADSTMVFAGAFYLNDKANKDKVALSGKRISTITLSNTGTSKDVYHVQLETKYSDGGGVEFGSSIVSQNDYDEVPSIYAVYTPMTSSDELYFINDLESDDLEDEEGEVVPVKFFLSVQKGSGIANIANANIKIGEEDTGPYIPIEDYIKNTNNTVDVYTDVLGDKSSLVENIKSDKLYDLTVKVDYNTGKKYKTYATFKSSKLNLG